MPDWRVDSTGESRTLLELSERTTNCRGGSFLLAELSRLCRSVWKRQEEEVGKVGRRGVSGSGGKADRWSLLTSDEVMLVVSLATGADDRTRRLTRFGETCGRIQGLQQQEQV